MANILNRNASTICLNLSLVEEEKRRKIAKKYYAMAVRIYERCLFDAAFHHRFTNNISHMNQHFVE